MKFITRTIQIICLGTVMTSVFSLTATADPLAEQGRAVFEQHHQTVVTVQLVVKQKFSMAGMPSQEDESKVEVTGTVIDPDGLTVLALSSTDPTSIFRNMMGGMGGQDFQMDTEVSDVRILMSDAKEIPAQIVLRDVDLDLAFLRPTEKPETPFAHVDLNNSGEAQIMDAVVTLNRLGNVANRVYAASFERINAIVERPRKFYIPGDDITTTEQGSPAFTLEGKLLGLFVLRSIRDTGGGSSMFGGGNENIVPIILPVRDILDGIDQVPPFGEAIPEEPSEETESDEVEEESAEEEETETPAAE